MFPDPHCIEAITSLIWQHFCTPLLPFANGVLDFKAVPFLFVILCHFHSQKGIKGLTPQRSWVGRSLVDSDSASARTAILDWKPKKLFRAPSYPLLLDNYGP
ncbi:hypothetical protein EJ06DRAFT_306208 [Trichodelitschia bisporula]|uniref:Uncharacterized protein n=1 Tax=Trichodelitschia bisporula TaxID=703511 RepID=A0A6G1I328_9PEZI|nr:hypothetical protein EJ06DRAFT_306208 [Trichodelitschia bisporula]